MCGATTLIKTNMMAFGGPTLKPTLILGNPWVRRLRRAKPTNSQTAPMNRLVIKSVDKNGKKCVTGTKKLKESQEFPAGFGRAVGQHYNETQIEASAFDMADYDVDHTDDEQDVWDDALHGHTILELLTVAKNFTTPRP